MRKKPKIQQTADMLLKFQDQNEDNFINPKNKREGEKKIDIVEGGYPRKMVGSSAAEAAVTKATNKRKREKTRPEKDAHNLRCVEDRKKKKARFVELEKIETEYNQMQDVWKIKCMENTIYKQRANRELEETKSKLQCRENEIRMLRRALGEKVANEAWMRQIPTRWKINGQNFSSLDESVAWFASQEYGQVSQGVLINPGAGSSFGSNYDLPNVFDGPNNHDNIGLSAAGALINPGAGSSFGANYDLPNVFDAGALINLGAGSSFGANYDLPDVFDSGVLINPGSGSSFGANHDLPNVFDAPNNHDNIGMFTHDSAAGVLSNSGASSSFGANADLPSVFDTPNNHDNNGSPF